MYKKIRKLYRFFQNKKIYIKNLKKVLKNEMLLKNMKYGKFLKKLIFFQKIFCKNMEYFF